MEQKSCIFCSIVSKQTPSKIVYEDSNCVAFLDIAPRSTGMTIVASKEHYREFDENPELSTAVFHSAQTVAKMLKHALNPLSVDFSIIPSQEIPHFHIRVYPVYEREIPLVENQPKKMTEEELNEIAAKIKSVGIETRKEEIVHEVKEEEPRRQLTPEEVEEIKRMMELT
jgi:histidine triad (HIT) family protein